MHMAVFLLEVERLGFKGLKVIMSFWMLLLRCQFSMLVSDSLSRLRTRLNSHFHIAKW